MTNDILKAGVLEVTVVQAVGVGLHGSSTTLARGRRKPAILARVTVDGTAKSGPPAPRSHHPVWFPAPVGGGGGNPGNLLRAPHYTPQDLDVVDRSAGGPGVDEVNPGQPARGTFRNAPDDDVHGDALRGVGLLDRTRERYGSNLSGGDLGGGVGRGGGDASSAGAVRPNSSAGIARGLLFEVREFYGPCRIHIELVSGGGSGGGGAAGAGGTVLGRCEARLAEALVGRGGAVSSASADLKVSSKALLSERVEKSGDVKSQDSLSLSQPRVTATAVVTDATSRNAGDPAVGIPTQSTACLPGGGIFGRWRRRRSKDNRSATNTVSDADDRQADVGETAMRAERTKVDSDIGVSNVRRTNSGRMSWGRGAFTREKSLSLKFGRELSKLSTSSSVNSNALSIEDAEVLAMTDWGGRGSSGGTGSAKDVWKELLPPGGSSGRTGGGVGAGVTGGSGVLSAVRLRLRFVPIWDCLEGGEGCDGLGALHAAARDGDSRMVHSLVLLWETLRPGDRPLTLKCRRGLTPIQHCIEGGSESSLRELLRTPHGRSSLQVGGKEGEDTALHTAIKFGKEAMLRMLLSATRRSEIPSRVLRAVQFGLGTPPNTFVDIPGADGLSPLSLAAMCGYEAMVKCLLEEGADASKTDARGMTALAHAAQEGKVLAVRVLLKAKSAGGSGMPGLRQSRLAKMSCSPCKTNEDGMGPLALAAANGAHQVVSELIRADVPYRTRDREGRTPLHHAAAGGHVAVLRVLVAEMRKGKGGSVAGPGGAVGPSVAADTAASNAVVLGDNGVGGLGYMSDGEDVKKSIMMRDHSLMMDGGPFRISNLDLAGRSAHNLAVLNKHPQAAAFLEAASAELDTRQVKEPNSSKRRPWCGGSGGGGRAGQPPRAANASPLLRAAQGSGSGVWSWSGSGTPGRPSPMSSIGMDSASSIVASEDLSYEYVESDKE